MPKDSLKKLLNKFPYFFDKRSVSNFYKSQDVTNQQFQLIYDSLLSVCESFNLNKRCLIWKEQSVKFDYVINFVANYPSLKKVSLFKNEELLYMESYNYEDNVNTFFYSYNTTTLNDSYELQVSDNNEETYNIIPESKFRMEIETYEEYHIQKGFPENDEMQDDEYDHDNSLDRFGELQNIPRKKYIKTKNYYTTEPLFNNRLTEDDYHYMNRILNYNLKFHNTPLPILELWKSYGVPSEMLNRERLLLKVFDETKHPNQNNHVLDWTPEPWEHKDGVCDGGNLSKYYFLVKLNTNIPKKGDSVYLDFKLLNSLLERFNGEYSVNAFIGGDLFKENIHNIGYINSSELDEINPNFIQFIAYDNNNEVLGECTVEIQVKGCNNANWYVSSEGNDNNSGDINHPFKTLDKALSEVTSTKQLIVVQGEITLETIPTVTQDSNILGCGQATIINDDTNKFFKIIGGHNVNLSLTNITLQNDDNSIDITSMNYTNSNNQINNYLTVIC